MESLPPKEIANIIKDRISMKSGIVVKYLRNAVTIRYNRKTVAQKLKIFEKIRRTNREYNEHWHHLAAETLFLHDWVFGGHNFVSTLFMNYSTQTAFGKIRQTIQNLYRRYKESIDRGEYSFKNILGVENALSTFLAYHIAITTYSFYRRPLTEDLVTNPGARITISSVLGAGKTSLAFWSCIVALRTLGLTYEEAYKVTRSLYTNDLEDFVNLLAEATELAMHGRMIPFIVLDDAVSAGFSKYKLAPGYGSHKLERRILTKISEALTIAREGIGAIIIVGHQKALMKPLREEEVDYLIEGIALQRSGGGMSTIWVIRRPTLTKTSSLSKTPIDVTGTITPLILPPLEIYRELTEIKFQHRISLLSDIMEDLRKLLEEKEQREETETEASEE